MMATNRNKARGKDAERRFAKAIGGKRNPDTGGHVPDVETEAFAYELKSKVSYPDWFLSPFAQIRRATIGSSKTPVVVFELREPGKKVVRFYCMDEAAFFEEHGEEIV